MKNIILAFWTLSIAFGSAEVRAREPMGLKPAYILGGVSSVPNQQAISKTIWAPGLDDGFVPQGLTNRLGQVLISGYKSTDPKVSTGLCRVFSVSTTDGRLTGYFDLPDDCGHAGGLAIIGDGTIVVSDTRTLYKIDLKKALISKNTSDSLISVVKLGGALKGSFVDFDGTDLWVGSSEKDAAKAKAFRLSLDVFNRFNGKPAIREETALSSIAIPVEANGMAFDRQGSLWLASSSSKFGTLYRLNPKTGEVHSQFDMVIGIEDLGFDAEGKLWAVSEAGSKRWSKWSKTYPLIFQIDTNLLK
jgi:sugar lactone lactonase YvrE